MSRPITRHMVSRAGPPIFSSQLPAFSRLLLPVTLILAGLAGAQQARAGNQVTDWNQEFLNITQQTSGNFVAGPPEVAREIAIIGNAMSDAVNAATGSTISSYAYKGGPVSGANASVAAAAAAYTALSGIFHNAAWQTALRFALATTLGWRAPTRSPRSRQPTVRSAPFRMDC
jgi:hypothetical protein